MITPQEAGNLVLKTTGYKKVTEIRDYDKNHYIVEALPENPNKINQVTFGVDKTTGAVTTFLLNSETIDDYLDSKIIYN